MLELQNCNDAGGRTAVRCSSNTVRTEIGRPSYAGAQRCEARFEFVAGTHQLNSSELFVGPVREAIRQTAQDFPRCKPKRQRRTDELATISQRLEPLGVQTRLIRSKDLADTKLIVESECSQVKIEVNVVFRGTALPVEYRSLSTRTSDLFGVEFETPILARDELYAGKLVAALDRQHPRDLFDVWQLYETGGLTEGMADCFVIYLAGHNRPPHEVLFGTDKDVSAEYERAFVGMTEVECSLNTLLVARSQLRHDLPRLLTDKHKQFLVGLVRAQPD